MCQTLSFLDTVIILNWKKPEVTLDCLASIFESGHPPFKVFVADNGSADGSLERLRQSPFPIELIGLDSNYGFTGGSNRAAQYVLKNYPCTRNLMFLNNDTLVEPGALVQLFDTLNESDRVGIVTPLILHYPEVGRVWAAGTDFDEFTFAARRSLAGSRITASIHTTRQLKWATGCCLTIRAELFERTGGFWDELFMSAEDIDLSFKVRKAGFDILYLPSSVVYHKDAVSSGGHDNPLYVYYQMRNELYFRKKWIERRDIRVYSYVRLFLSVTKRCAIFIATRNFVAVRAVATSLLDFFLGRSGKRKPF
jgi:GT2 family glycosyltransferase